MADYRITAQLQHAIQHPAPHLDRWANFGPAFEMPDAPTPTGVAAVRILDTAPLEQPLNDTEIAALESLNQPTGATFNPRAFITAGAAIFTLQGLQARYTYRVNRKEPEAGSRYTEPAYFVSLLTGADNLHDYTYIGMLDTTRGTIRFTKASKYREDSQPVKAFNWAIGRIWNSKTIEPAKLYHVGRCGRCGRALTVPASIESGFGPECAGKLGE